MPRFGEDGFLRLIRGQTPGLPAHAARLGLGVVGAGYGVGVAARNLAFDRGWLKSARVPVPVVSIGNLTLGGTGKTPMVEWVARWYRQKGRRVAILSRGYQRGGSGGVNDEAMVLEQNLPDVPHLQDPDRTSIARIAVEELESELLILDDGFQHRHLARDLDIVLLDALDPFGLRRLFPRGLLREPVRSLHRADLVVLTRSDLVEDSGLREIRRLAERTAGPIRWVITRHAPVELVGEGVESESVDPLRQKTVAAFCGIGNPEGFRRSISGLCGTLAGFRTFPDHHGYTARDVDELSRWASDLGADLVLTTQKDLVKLRVAALGSVSLRALRIGLEVTEGHDSLVQSLAAILPSPVV